METVETPLDPPLPSPCPFSWVTCKACDVHISWLSWCVLVSSDRSFLKPVISAQKIFTILQTKHACDLQSFDHTHNYVGVVMGVAHSTPSI